MGHRGGTWGQGGTAGGTGKLGTGQSRFWQSMWDRAGGTAGKEWKAEQCSKTAVAGKAELLQGRWGRHRPKVIACWDNPRPFI